MRSISISLSLLILVPDDWTCLASWSLMVSLSVHLRTDAVDRLRRPVQVHELAQGVTANFRTVEPQTVTKVVKAASEVSGGTEGEKLVSGWRTGVHWISCVLVVLDYLGQFLRL